MPGILSFYDGRNVMGTRGAGPMECPTWQLSLPRPESRILNSGELAATRMLRVGLNRTTKNPAIKMVAEQSVWGIFTSVSRDADGCIKPQLCLWQERLWVPLVLGARPI